MEPAGKPNASDGQNPRQTELQADAVGVERKLSELGMQLPRPFKPLGEYSAYHRVGNLILLAGQGSIQACGGAIQGKVGDTLTVSDGVRAAEMTVLNILAQVREICDLDRVEAWVRLTGFVNSAPDFERHIEVLDGATNLLTTLYGKAGLAARAAIGVNSLPMNIAVEIQAEFTVRP